MKLPYKGVFTFRSGFSWTLLEPSCQHCFNIASYRRFWSPVGNQINQISKPSAPRKPDLNSFLSTYPQHLPVSLIQLVCCAHRSQVRLSEVLWRYTPFSFESYGVRRSRQWTQRLFMLLRAFICFTLRAGFVSWYIFSRSVNCSCCLRSFQIPF